MKLVARSVLFVAGALAMFLFAGASPQLVDDTFITLQYARNLAETGALVWHPSLPAVDGFTSLGHVLMIALGHRLGLGTIGWNSWIVILSAVSILAMLVWATRSLSLLATFAALLLTTANVALAFWISAGLDAVTYAAVFFAVYLSYERAISEGRLNFQSGVSLVALAIMRPEGMFIASALIAVFWASRVALPSKHLQSSIAISALVLLTIAIQILWRISEFGHPLPNTFYAKASENRLLEVQAGLVYFFEWVRFSWGALLAISLIALLLGSRFYLRGLFILGQIAVVILAGGDPHPSFRFFLPILPLVALDAAWVVNRLGSRFAAIGIIILVTPLTIKSHLSLGRLTLPDPVEGLSHTLAGKWPMNEIGDSPLSERQASAA